MSIFIIGAAGGIGARLSSRLQDRGQSVLGYFRNPAHEEQVKASGATPVLGDLIAQDVPALAEQLRGSDAVIFTAGAHGTGQEQTTLIDGEGLKKAVDAAKLAGVQRFILVSVFPEAGRGGELGAGFEHYMKVKKDADVYLASSGLDWVIVRPGTLHSGRGDGKVRAGLAIPYGPVERDNVAAFIDAALATPQLSRIIVELTDGPIPVAQAVDELVKKL